MTSSSGRRGAYLMLGNPLVVHSPGRSTARACHAAADPAATAAAGCSGTDRSAASSWRYIRWKSTGSTAIGSPAASAPAINGAGSANAARSAAATAGTSWRGWSLSSAGPGPGGRAAPDRTGLKRFFWRAVDPRPRRSSSRCCRTGAVRKPDERGVHGEVHAADYRFPGRRDLDGRGRPGSHGGVHDLPQDCLRRRHHGRQQRAGLL